MLRNPVSAFCFVAILCAAMFAQEPSSRGNDAGQQNTQAQQANPGQKTGSPRIAPGSVIPVELTKGIDAKKAKTGDPVEAKVTMDLKTDSGEVLVPKDTKVLGHVTEAQPRSKEQKESQVAIAFDHAVMKSGANMPLPLSIQAVISPSVANGSNNNAPNEGTGQSASQPSSGGGATATGTRGGMGAGTPPPQAPGVGAGAPPDSSSQAGGRTHEPITGKTEGVVGISNLKLAPAAQPAQGSVLTSEKNNVKLESGTLMLLKVNP